ncbi:MAG TPA: DUF5985 family protein [Terriglobales bacterium]|nr:DUF5985 family protein [Terriglobales bacterium]
MSLYLQGLGPIAHPRLDLFLLGYIAAVSAAAALFFLRYWKETRDFLFLAFAVFFAVQGAVRAHGIYSANPNLVIGWLYALRTFAVVLVVAAIIRKNFRRTVAPERKNTRGIKVGSQT